MTQHICGRCRAVLNPVNVTQHTSKLGLMETGVTLEFRCACGNSFKILSEGRKMMLLFVGGLLTMGGLTILGLGPGHADRTLKGLLGLVIGLVTFTTAVRARLAASRNPPVPPPDISTR
jgi:hypothetical protein